MLIQASPAIFGITTLLQLFPQWFITIFGGSSVVVTTLVAILLNQILPPDNGEDDE